MTVSENMIHDTERPWLMIPDSEENIARHLEAYTLDPTFELHGNFVNRHPQWLDAKLAEERKGCTVIFGNFLNYTHAFRVVTDDEALIARLEAAIRKNQTTTAYQAARRKALAEVPVLYEFSKAAHMQPGMYLFKGLNPEGEIIEITRVYRLTEEEANGNNLLYLERWEGRDSEGRLIGAAFHDGDKLSTTLNWSMYRETKPDSIKRGDKVVCEKRESELR